MSSPTLVKSARLSSTVPCFELPSHPSPSDLPLLTRSEVATRIASGELLVIHLPYLYKIPLSWLQLHPGRDLAILHYVGRDASNEIEAYHTGKTVAERMVKWICGRVEVGEDGWRDMVPPIMLSNRVREDEDYWRSGRGKLTAEMVDPPLVEGEELPLTPAYQHHLRQSHRKLGQRLHALGYDKTPRFLAGYAYVLCIYVALFCLWVYLYCRATTTFDYVLTAIAMGAWWHQITFAAHDAGHTHITGDWFTDKIVGGFVADFLGGLSIGWWCDNHNVHHLVTNMPEHDPDIQHVPFFAISPKFFESLRSSYHKHVMPFDEACLSMLKNQHKLYYLIMTIARVDLVKRSYKFLATTIPVRASPNSFLWKYEIAGLMIFWCWFGRLLYGMPGWGTRFLFLYVTYATTSPQHVQIVTSHFGQSVSITTDVIPHAELLESHAHRQLRTTTDLSCPPYLDFLHGGLNWQVVHHLYPRLPRFKLRAAATEIQAWVREEQELVKNGTFNGQKLKPGEGLVYKQIQFTEANKNVLGVLKNIADQVRVLGMVAQAEAKGELHH
ncbi:fatty acid/sphingolipid desaturase [Meredithblackwellia eburnea MCA 4105]